MKRLKWIATLRSASVSLAIALFAITSSSTFAHGQAAVDSVEPVGSDTKSNLPTTDEVLKRVDSLVQQNEQLEKQNHELINVISAMRRALAEQSHSSEADAKEIPPDESGTSPNRISPMTAAMVESINSISSSSASAGMETTNAAAGQEERKRWATYTPNFGYKIANTEYGDVNLSIYSYARYLNQRALAANLHECIRQHHKPSTAPGLPTAEGADKVLGLGDGSKAPLFSLRMDFKRFAGPGCPGGTRREFELHLQRPCHHNGRNHVAARHTERRRQLSVLAGSG